jgi:putative addiction module killer protein
VHQRTLLSYKTENGIAPFDRWLKKLKDGKGRFVIENRLSRVELFGHEGRSRYVGEGVCELKIDFGPGYRVYYGEDGVDLILLLSGGDKSSQEKDIRKAQFYLADYRRRKHETL